MSQKEDKPISQQLDELKRKIDWFYSEDFKLDNAIERYEEVIKLTKLLEKQLDTMKNKVEILSKNFAED